MSGTGLIDMYNTSFMRIYKNGLKDMNLTRTHIFKRKRSPFTFRDLGSTKNRVRLLSTLFYN